MKKIIIKIKIINKINNKVNNSKKWWKICLILNKHPNNLEEIVNQILAQNKKIVMLKIIKSKNKKKLEVWVKKIYLKY